MFFCKSCRPVIELVQLNVDENSQDYIQVEVSNFDQASEIKPKIVQTHSLNPDKRNELQQIKSVIPMKKISRNKFQNKSFNHIARSAEKKLTSFIGKSLEELLKTPKELDEALCRYFKSVNLKFNTLKTYHSALKSKIVELSNESVDISNPEDFPNYHVSFDLFQGPRKGGYHGCWAHICLSGFWIFLNFFSHLSRQMGWTYELYKVFGLYPGEKYLKTI